MKTSDFNYELPEELIAQNPAEPRDSSRLLVYERKTDTAQSRHFSDLPQFLRKGDVLVLNDTRVIPARLLGTKEGTEREVEFLLLKRLSLTNWEVILRPGKKLRPGDWVRFTPELCAQIVSKKQDGVCEVQFEFEGSFEQILDRCGRTPLPPYIHNSRAPRERYQTVYARVDGSAAAPTAGLHFTNELLQTLQQMGVEIHRVLLHVGLGTFRPVKEETVEAHEMHCEYYEVPEETAQAVNAAHTQRRRVIAVGTTSVRALESAWNGESLEAKAGDTDIFIYPGYKFGAVDGLITNFHLPESTLLMLVSAFIGDTDRTLRLYNEAVADKYRFFSFGDAMLIV